MVVLLGDAASVGRLTGTSGPSWTGWCVPGRRAAYTWSFAVCRWRRTPPGIDRRRRLRRRPRPATSHRRPPDPARPAAARRAGRRPAGRPRRPGLRRPAAGRVRRPVAGAARGPRRPPTGCPPRSGDRHGGAAGRAGAGRRPAARADRRPVGLRQDQPVVRLAGRPVRPLLPRRAGAVPAGLQGRRVVRAVRAERRGTRAGCRRYAWSASTSTTTASSAWPCSATWATSCAAGPPRQALRARRSWPSCAPRTRAGAGRGSSP